MKKEIIISDTDDMKTYLKWFRLYHLLNLNKELFTTYKYDALKIDREVLESLINAHNIKNKNKRLEYVYDTACSYIDDNYVSKNFCEFIDDQCLYQRNHKKSMNQKDGCCRNCKYLNYGCSQKALADKLFFCYYIRKVKKCPRLNDILILKYFLNIKQKAIAKTIIYYPREESIKALKRKSLLLWCLTPRKKNT